MFRVPSSATAPTFDDVFKVSFGRWLTSSKADRVEWARRRNAAAEVARVNAKAEVARFKAAAREGVAEARKRRGK